MMAKYIDEYYEKINSGEIVVGIWIKKVYDYIIEGLKSGQFSFDEAKAQKAIDWIENKCFHTEGILAPGNLKLELWQKAFVASIFGIVDDNGYR